MARWLNKANANMNRFTLAQLALNRDDNVLEIGFGGGDLLERILSANLPGRVAGVDRSADMVKVVTQRLHRYVSEKKLELRRGEVESLPYEASEFSKVCSVNTLYFWRDSAVALSECRRVLRPGGQIALCFNDKKDLEAWPPHKHGFRLYELEELEAVLGGAGFSQVQVVSLRDEGQGLVHCVSAVAA